MATMSRVLPFAALRESTGLPDRVLARLLQSPGALGRSLVRLGLVAAGYAGSVLLLGAGGGSPGIEPWLRIPKEDYFYWEAAFIAPVIVGAALVAAVVAYLLAKALGGRGDFDTTLSAIACATAVATLFTLVPDFLEGALTTVGAFDGARWAEALTRLSAPFLFLWTYIALYAVAFLMLYPAAVRMAQGMRGLTALTAGWAAFAVYQGILFIFVR
ncbi:MAG TPA: hypothetical protein VH951_02120 [Dehalococcoidia bacterium]